MDFKKQEMVEISLSFFDLILGPRLIASLPWVDEISQNPFISEFFDVHNADDFFTHIFQDYLSFNFLFSIPNPSIIRGGNRLLMLTASIPFNLLKRKDILQYYPSLESLFREWANDIKNKPQFDEGIKDGQKDDQNTQKSILKTLDNYLGELQFILSVMPDTISIPVEKVKLFT